MRNDFMPVHLMNANAKLDKHVLAPEANEKAKDGHQKGESLWKKFLGLFKKNR